MNDLTEYEQSNYDELIESWFNKNPVYKDAFQMHVLEEWQKSNESE